MRLIALLASLLTLAILHLLAQAPPPAGRSLALALGAEPADFREVVFVNASLARTTAAAVVGAMLGLAGSLLQQLLRNPLASPTTLGVASGAWLGLVAGTVLAPAAAAANGVLFAFGGAVLAGAMVFAIAGPRGMAGLPAILAGMAVSLLLGALARAFVLLEDQRARDLGIWAAGDLGQATWADLSLLLPVLLTGLLGALACSRALTLLRLGFDVASGRGLALAFFAPVVGLAALGLTASAIAAVGPIAFVGLLAPAIARLAGAASSRDELIAAAGLGAAALLGTDAVAIVSTGWAAQLITSGAIAPLIGAPVLILLLLQRRGAELPSSWITSAVNRRPVLRIALSLAAALALTSLGALLVGRQSGSWSVALPTALEFGFRWPRALAAAAAGMALAIAGSVLQRLLRNPLASPDVIGVSGGAAFGVVLSVLILGISLGDAAMPAAALGASTALGALLLLARLRPGDPFVLALTGLSLAALLEALLSLGLAWGGEEVFSLLGWLSGSTLRVGGPAALRLTALMLPLIVMTLLLARWLDLLTLGRFEAAARGVPVALAIPVFLVIAGTATGVATATIGLAPFVGLAAPHIARLLTASSARGELCLSALTGALLMLAADWIGRTALHPIQLPVGLVAALLGGTYMVVALSLRRR
ncbi:MAG: iron ABC transporter permease [Pseudomonadota bacterium]